MKPAVHPLTPERWDDFAALFGPRGACAHCWCMWWRLEAADWRAGKAGGNRDAMKRLVDEGHTPGLLLYVGNQAAAWCALAPRGEYVRLRRSRILSPVDAAPVWSVSCFFVARPHRRQGLTVELLRAAAEFARSRGAEILEGYPVEVTGPAADTFLYHGTAGAFRRAGFREVARRSPTRPIFRKALRPRKPEPGSSGGRSVETSGRGAAA